MGVRRSYSERLEDLKKRREELRQQERALMARQIAQERKERTKRLLRIGSEIEAAAGRPIGDEELELIVESVRDLLADCTQERKQDNALDSGKTDGQNCMESDTGAEEWGLNTISRGDRFSSGGE